MRRAKRRHYSRYYVAPICNHPGRRCCVVVDVRPFDCRNVRGLRP
jgi:hypothetical protein